METESTTSTVLTTGVYSQLVGSAGKQELHVCENHAGTVLKITHMYVNHTQKIQQRTPRKKWHLHKHSVVSMAGRRRPTSETKLCQRLAFLDVARALPDLHVQGYNNANDIATTTCQRAVLSRILVFRRSHWNWQGYLLLIDVTMVISLSSSPNSSPPIPGEDGEPGWSPASHKRYYLVHLHQTLLNMLINR